MLNYTAIRDEIIQVPTLYSDNIMLYRPENTGTNKYLSLSVGQQINWGRYFRKFIKSELSFSMVECCRFLRNRKVRDTFLRANNTININKNIQCFVNGSYQSASENGLFKIPQAWNVDLALNLSFLSDRLNIYLECTDIFFNSTCKNEVVTETIYLWIIVETIKPVHSQYKFHITYLTLSMVRDIKVSYMKLLL